MITSAGSTNILLDQQETNIDLTEMNRSIIAMMPDGIVAMDFSMTIKMCNPAMERMFGWLPGSLVGQKISVLIPQRYRPQHGANVAAFEQGPVNSRTMGNRAAHTYGIRKDGTEIALGISIMKSQTSAGLMFFALIRDRSEWVRESEELERLANTDPLSGLPNRRAFTSAAELAIEQSASSGLPLAVLMIDLDHFKSVNDRFGHEGGDCVIRDLPPILKDVLRQTDLIARWGGEEFIALLPSTTEDAALAIAERLRWKIAATPFTLTDGQTIPITASLGVIVCNSGQEILDTIVQRADRALYAAKKAGRNRAYLFREDED
ncbi:MAG TPA: diguanylate cyclase [Rhizobium sp.]